MAKEEIDKNTEYKRREFLKFLGASGLALSGLSWQGIISADAAEALLKNVKSNSDANSPLDLPFVPLSPQTADRLVTVQGLTWERLITEGDRINLQGDLFGANNDFLALIPAVPLKNSDHSKSVFSQASLNKKTKKEKSRSSEPQSSDYLLFVNHEYVDLKSKLQTEADRTVSAVSQQMHMVGASVVKIRKSKNKWSVVENDPANRRWNAHTPMQLSQPLPDRFHSLAKSPLANKEAAAAGEEVTTVRGTLANCSGGETDWGSVLTCEENYSYFVGERLYQESQIAFKDKHKLCWHLYYDMPPEHYGWVAEINLHTGVAKKLISMGRMAHESAKFTRSQAGYPVVYLGDDTENQCLYKFISNSKDSLDHGDLYVANLEKGEWIKLDIQSHDKLKNTFRSQVEVMIYARLAAKLVGGTELDRPEDIEIDPLTQDVFVALTNNKIKNRPYGSILKIKEKSADSGALSFEHETFIMGSKTTGMACPDNFCLDLNGNLWMTSDVAGDSMNKGDYVGFGNNSLFFIPLVGQWAGQLIRVATAPVDAEFTGPCMAPDGKTLFLSVQHPGEHSPSLTQLTSHWPFLEKSTELPRSAVVQLSGPTLEYLTGPAFQRK